MALSPGMAQGASATNAAMKQAGKQQRGLLPPFQNELHTKQRIDADTLRSIERIKLSIEPRNVETSQSPTNVNAAV